MVLGIFGAGGLAREVLELAKLINEKESRWTDFIFVDKEVGNDINGVKVYSYNDAIKQFAGRIEATMGIGEPAIREKVFNELKRDGINLATLIHPDVYISKTTKIGKGVTIQMGNFISSNVIIEDYVYIQPHANIGHDDVLKKGCVVSGFCNLAGGVTVGEFTYLGISSCYKQGISIGNNSIISMGAVVFDNIPDNVIAMGHPARIIRKNEERCVFK